MYEISPYATFSMSGGAVDCEEEGSGSVGSTAAGAGSTLRTFGRAEPAPLLAAPSRLTHHREQNSAGIYYLSVILVL